MAERNSYPYRYDRTTTIASIKERFDSLEPGSETAEHVAVAGRIPTIRSHGKVAFADLKDSTGTIQLFAQHAVLGDAGMGAFLDMSVGDIVGAEGNVVMTKRGELSVKVSATTVLAPCLRPMPEKWHGMTDVETRYRQRYLDLISNPDARRTVGARANANAAIRRFFDDRGFVEVETPILHPIAGGALARPFVTHHNALDVDLFLRIAPELYLKRLLIGGFERVYELNRVFRNEGVSTKHNPEFTMLEAYEAYVDYETTMALVEDLVREITQAVTGSLQVAYQDRTIDIGAPFARTTMFAAIRDATGEDVETPWRAGDDEGVRAAATAMGLAPDASWSRGKVVAEMYETRVEKSLIEPTFVVGFPKDVSPLAKDHRSIDGFTEHADLVLAGLEIAPIYSELNDPDEQRRRFETQAAARSAGDEEAPLPDEDFIEALAYGMPPAGGFGLGVDRLLTILLGAPSIREIVLFPTLRPES